MGMRCPFHPLENGVAFPLSQTQVLGLSFRYLCSNCFLHGLKIPDLSASFVEKKGLEMRKREDFTGALKGIEVFQLTEENKCPACHVYMEAQIFTPDSKRFVLHRSATAHGGKKDDPEHRYLLCNIEDNCSLAPLTDETGVTGPSISPDGRYFYYFVDETETNAGRLTLKRKCLLDNSRETILAMDKPLNETGTKPSRIYPLSTISSDGAKIAISAFIGDGRKDNSPFGLMVIDIQKASVSMILQGQTWCNMHPQYCRSTDPELKRNILIQENHGNVHDRYGQFSVLVGGNGADIHVIRDDGTGFRTMPWGRDGNEFCTGHECWRGKSEWAITSNSQMDTHETRLVEGKATEDKGHIGLKTPGGIRNDLSRGFEKPKFNHFATDIEGKLIISDYFGKDLYMGRLQEAGRAVVNWKRLLSTNTSGTKENHIHPFLSPDGTNAFFNSDESGILQAYMITCLPG